MLGVVGVIGSGKTTLAQLLLRFYDPTAGTLLIGGHPIKEIPLQKLRGSIGYVSQEPFLFSTSIRDNIVLGRGVDLDLEEIVRIAGLKDDVARFPQGIGYVDRRTRSFLIWRSEAKGCSWPAP